MNVYFNQASSISIPHTTCLSVSYFSPLKNSSDYLSGSFASGGFSILSAGGTDDYGFSFENGRLLDFENKCIYTYPLDSGISYADIDFYISISGSHLYYSIPNIGFERIKTISPSVYTGMQFQHSHDMPHSAEIDLFLPEIIYSYDVISPLRVSKTGDPVIVRLSNISDIISGSFMVYDAKVIDGSTNAVSTDMLLGSGVFPIEIKTGEYCDFPIYPPTGISSKNDVIYYVYPSFLTNFNSSLILPMVEINYDDLTGLNSYGISILDSGISVDDSSLRYAYWDFLVDTHSFADDDPQLCFSISGFSGECIFPSPVSSGAWFPRALSSDLLSSMDMMDDAWVPNLGNSSLEQVLMFDMTVAPWIYKANTSGTIVSGRYMKKYYNERYVPSILPDRSYPLSLYKIIGSGEENLYSGSILCKIGPKNVSFGSERSFSVGVGSNFSLISSGFNV